MLWANLGTLNGISDPRKINWLEPSSANAQYPKAGENNTIESWAEKYNALGLTPNSHCTVIDCGGQSGDIYGSGFSGI